MKKTIKLSLTLVALLSQLHAKDIELSPITVTSTAIATDELHSTDAVEVYTQEDIEKAHVQNLYEFLNLQTSITSSSYGNPFAQKLDLHGYGVNGYQNIVITINGRKINDIDNSTPLLVSISPASISRIEIIKSSGIVKGGDGANAGAINITTKQNNEKEVTLYGGTYGLFDSSIYIGHSDDKLSISASTETQRQDGIRDINTGKDKDKKNFTTGTFSISYAPIEILELRAGASFARTDVNYASYLTLAQYKDDPTQKGAYPAESTYDTDAYNAGISYDLTNNTIVNLDGYHEKKKSHNYSTANYKYNSLESSIDYTGDTVNFSMGFNTFDGERATSNNKMSKINNSGFIMSEFYLGKSRIKAGYRYEEVAFKSQNADTKNDTLHGVELGYNFMIDKETSLFANYSHSYESASLDRLFNFTTGAFMGYVEPAKVHNYTLGLNVIQPINKFKISAFYADLKNEIYYYSDPIYVNSKNTNIDKSHKYGIDLYDKFLITPEFSIVLNYNYVQAIIDDEKQNGEDYSGNNLPGVSNHNVKATLSYMPNNHATIALTQIYRSEAYASDDFNNNFSQKQEAYKSTDISATYAQENWEVFAKINNLFNQKNGVWTKDNTIYPINFTTTALAGLKLKF